MEEVVVEERADLPQRALYDVGGLVVEVGHTHVKYLQPQS
jgi:hypothetical protein